MALQKCPKCNAPLSRDALAGLCPACLMAMADSRMVEPASGVISPIQDRQFGDFVLGRQLGSGGMGVVYEAHQVSLNRKVALKFIRDSQVASPNLLRRFTIEAEATARLNHPGIVGIHEIGEVEGHPFFSMDLIDGESLRSAMLRGHFVLRVDQGTKTNGRSRQVEIARLIAKTARAVHHAHQRGVLHRDLKPANILLDGQNEPHLTDFGLAKILRTTTEGEAKVNLTPRTEIAGTAPYMAPEQVSSDEVTAAADVYGLGAVLYELLTGQQPFKAATLFETLKQLQELPPRRLRLLNPFVDRDLETICLKCLEKNPTHRYATAEALAEDLERWVDHKPIRAASPTPFVRTRRWMKRNPAGTALIMVLFVAFVGALLLFRNSRIQRKEIELKQAFASDYRVTQLGNEWRDVNKPFLVINSKDLDILDNLAPFSDPDARTFRLGAIVEGDPISYAQHLTSLLRGLEQSMRNRLSRPVELDFVAIKHDRPQPPFLQGTVHFMLMNATEYFQLKASSPGMRVFARVSHQIEGALVANAASGLTNIQQLRGKVIGFPSPTEPLTIWSKARLAEAGIVSTNFRAVTNFDNSDMQPTFQRHESILSTTRGRDIATSVLRGEVDVAVTYRRRYEYASHQGLVLVDSFVSTPQLIVAEAGLANDVIDALRAALEEARPRQPEAIYPRATYDWDETFPGAVPIDDKDLLPFRDAMRKAALFDGLPDPFPELGPIK